MQQVHTSMRGAQFNLKGKNVLITGAATGIGSSIVQVFSECGANIGLHFNSSVNEAKKLEKRLRSNGNLKLFASDLTDFRMVQSLMDNFLKEFKTIDVLINNAGGVLGAKNFLDLDEHAWDETFALNVKSAFFLSREAFKKMKENEKGKIINISSVAAKFGGSDKSMHYGAAKAALESLTIGLSRYGAPYNILVNCIRGGFINTDFHKKMGRSNSDIEKRIQMIPLKRAGQPEDIASMAAYLASPCGDFITGQIVSVTGGD